MKIPFTPTERSAKLVELTAALRDYHAAMNRERFNDADLLWTRATKAESDYFGRLPRPAMSCCPFDGEPLYRTFDPFGFDGPWWRPDASPREVPPCPHFCCLRGAVNFRGRKPRGGEFEAGTGPEVPYVIPRILEKPGVVAVVSQMDMAPAHIAYIVAYFAERRPPVQELAPNWPRPIFHYATALAEHRWRADDDAWDFDLAPWLARGKIRWCQPYDNTTLTEASEPGCPYLDLKGERQRMVVYGDHFWGTGLPARSTAAL